LMSIGGITKSNCTFDRGNYGIKILVEKKANSTLMAQIVYGSSSKSESSACYYNKRMYYNA